ncbi:MAG: FAD-binding protein [Bacteroidetes bacterium]|nr:FAD-binding protein [Bacteroidota bacterium]
MQQKIHLMLSPEDAVMPSSLKSAIALHCGIAPEDITGYHILKKSIDARSKIPYIQMHLQVFIQEPFPERSIPVPAWKNVEHVKRNACIIGAGPAGLFAALKLIELGIKPILFERGKMVKERRRDLALLNKKGILNPESNYCFGEGGAGTYSDGKLYTRSNKRGDINRILQLFVHFGAPANILWDAHPHIGTNKLPGIITAMRQCILACGGEIHFEKKLSGFKIKDHSISHINLASGEEIKIQSLILATGHSADDIYLLLKNNSLQLEAKPFALGVRIEHPQSCIDAIQYHHETRSEFLPPASYQLSTQAMGRGVFSFCMCPGGIIAPASTHPGQLVVNGWSPSKRNNPFANSGLVAEVNKHDVKTWLKEMKTWPFPDTENDPLLLSYFQKYVEEKSFQAGGGNFKAPAQRLVDFCNHKFSANLPQCSYIPGVASVELNKVLPPFIFSSLQQALKTFGNEMRRKKGKGFYTNDALVVATESRTSSPVRIPRDSIKMHHLQISNLFPCGEGAGYAGGIVSAAMDGERIAQAVASSRAQGL